MRSLLLMFMLLLTLLIHDAQGRRLSREGSVLAEDGKHTLHKEEFAEMKISTTHDERENKKWSSAGSIRKLIMIHISSTTTNAKNHKNGEIIKGDTKSEATSPPISRIGGKEENLSVNSSSKTQKLQDTIDIAEMDYTLARRKPPIHN